MVNSIARLIGQVYHELLFPRMGYPSIPKEVVKDMLVRI